MQPNLHEPPIYCRENRALCCCPRMDCSTSHEQASQRKSEGIQTTLPGHSLIHAGSEGGRRRGRKHAGPVSPGLCGLMQCGTSAPKGLLDRHQMRSGGEKRRDLPFLGIRRPWPNTHPATLTPRAHEEAAEISRAMTWHAGRVPPMARWKHLF